jgi:hypothetical protein
VQGRDHRFAGFLFLVVDRDDAVTWSDTEPEVAVSGATVPPFSSKAQ